MKKPVEQTNEDDVVIEQQERLRREALEHREPTSGDIVQDTRSTGGMRRASKPKQKLQTEKSLCDVAEKARRAPRDG